MTVCTNIRDIIQPFLGHSPLDTTAIYDHSDALCFHQFADRLTCFSCRGTSVLKEYVGLVQKTAGQYSVRGIIGKINREGYWREWNIVWSAETVLVSVGAISPVFVLRSYLGKLLLDISSLILCPFRKTLLVGHKSISILVGLLSPFIACL